MASNLEYMWLIVFQWSHKTETPFDIHVLNPTFKDIVPSEWITGRLLEGHRLSKLRIPTLVRSIPYSVFAKVEKGKLFFPYVNKVMYSAKM